MRWSGVADRITIHARTKRQGYRPPAHWHQLRQARQPLPFPVIANGELWTPSDIARCAKSAAATLSCWPGCAVPS
jgi:tRNA-dihydrouridine synthase C